MIKVRVELGAAQEVLSVLPEYSTAPGSITVEADPEMLKRVDSLAFLSVIDGVLVLDEAAQAAARQAKADLETALRIDARLKEIEAALRNATPQQISDYVDAQVIDLASARLMFKRILLLLASRLGG